MFHSTLFTAFAAAAFLFAFTTALPIQGLDIVAESRRESIIGLHKRVPPTTNLEARVGEIAERAIRLDVTARDVVNVASVIAIIDNAKAELGPLIVSLQTATTDVETLHALSAIKVILTNVEGTIAKLVIVAGTDATSLVTALVASLEGLPAQLATNYGHPDVAIHSTVTGVVLALASLIQTVNTLVPGSSTLVAQTLGGLSALLTASGVNKILSIFGLAL